MSEKKLQLPPDRQGRVGMVHELDCPWVNGENQDPEFVAQYREVEVVGAEHATCCATK